MCHCAQLELMKSCKDSESVKYKTLETLASATSPSSQLSTNDADDASQPTLLHQSSEEHKQDTKESLENVSCDSNNVRNDASPHDVAMNGASNDTADDSDIKVNRLSSTDMGQIPATNNEPLTDRGDEISGDDAKTSSMAYSGSKAVQPLDKLDLGGHEVESSDQLRQEDSFSIVSDRSDICFDRSDYNKGHDGQTLSNTDHTDHLGHRDGQTLSSTNRTDHLGDPDGQTLSNTDHTDHFCDHDGQTLSNTDHTDHLGDRNGQTLSSTDHTDHLGDRDGQTLSNTDHTDHLGDPDGQTLSNTDHTDHLGDHDGQTLSNTDHTDHLGDRDVQTLSNADHLGDRDGQTLSNTDHTDHLGDHDGQALSITDHTDQLGDPNGLPLSNTDHLDDHKGEPLCHIDQVVMVTRLPAPQVIMVDQANSQSVSK